MMRVLIVSALFIGFKSSALAAGDAVNGAKLYKKCIACHGKQGEGKKSQNAPRIGGQFDWYLLSQLKAFKSKERLNPKMLPFIKNLSNQDFEDLSAYISEL